MYTHLVSTPAAERFQRVAVAHRDAMRSQADQTVNALTIDVEDYFQVSAFAPFIERSLVGRHPVSRGSERRNASSRCSTEHSAKATFFTLGWIAERHPGHHPRDRRAGA